MRAISLVLMLVVSTLTPLASWSSAEVMGEAVNFRNGDEFTTPIEMMPNGQYNGFWVLSHEYPVPSEWIGELADEGIDCWSFLPPASFHCELNGHDVNELARLGVKGMLQMSPEAKLHPDVMPALNGETEAFLMIKGQGILNLVLSGDSLPEEIEQRSDITVMSHSWRWSKVEALTSGVEWLSKQSEIEWIEPSYEFTLYNNESDEIISADVLQSTTMMSGIDSSWSGLDGTGVIVTVADTGLDNGINNTNMHPDFRDHIVDIPSFGLKEGMQTLANTPYDDGGADLSNCSTCGNGHGTHVSGSVLGDGSASSGNIKGIAPEARLYMQAIETYVDWTTYATNTYGLNDGYGLWGIPDDLRDLFDPAAANGSDVHTNSWGSSVAGAYTTSAMQSDYAARNHSGMLILFAAANEGIDANSDGEIDLDSMGAPATAKNVLSVAASENNRPTITSQWGGWWPGDYPANPVNGDKMADNSEGLAAFSSRGPTDDGRLKPDVSAPGTFVLSSRSRSTAASGWGVYDSDYVYMGGTSMATPITAGAAALLYQHMYDNLANPNPSSALIKGIITASAHDMAGQYGSSTNGAGETAPNNHEGYGLLDLDRAVNTSYIDGESLTTGATLGFSFVVPSAAPDLKVMLSWTDPASTPSASTNLVNDLDFALKSPSGTWTEYANNLDNMYGAMVSSPAQGTWEVHINVSNVPTGPQEFALVLDAPYSMTNLSSDVDKDGVEDDDDDCPITSGTSTEDLTGCPDSDGDGWSDTGDDFPTIPTQWQDGDSDGYGDNPGGITPDGCVSIFGTSTSDRYGCIDTDSDTWSDSDTVWTALLGGDACNTVFGNSTRDRNGCLDTDGDGQSDINDILVNDNTQWTDSDGDGYYDNPNPATNWDDCPGVAGNSTVDSQGCLDTDGDGVSDSIDVWPNDPSRSIDTDSDGISDGDDDCPTIYGNSSIGLIGCPDSDGDGRPIEYDAFPSEKTQWNDTDNDGYGDNPAGNSADDCPTTYGDSWQNGTLGCVDSDGDGWADAEDSFPNEITQWTDSDGDGYGDNSAGVDPDGCPGVPGNSSLGPMLGCPDADGDGWADSNDALPNDPSQNADTDGDGFGDNPDGTNPDACPTIPGNSTIDRFGCIDTDGDGVSDLNDDFPMDPTRTTDSDADGYDDNEDDCPNTAGTSVNGTLGCFDADQDSWADANDSFPINPTQWNDTDGDGYGDNPTGLSGDNCPTVAGNSSYDLYGCIDSDGDGWSDTADLFIDDSSEWADNDTDGFGDNSDICPDLFGTATNGSLGCLDGDGDGWSDDLDFNSTDPSQWIDEDLDGYGDNPSGTDADQCVGEYGTSFENELGCLDSDGDGWSDTGDSFPEIESQHLDSDGDGYGDNSDYGSVLADHWPDDPTRNVAEATITCDETSMQIDIANKSDISFNCVVTNGIQYPLTVRIEWKAINAIDAAVRTQIISLEANESMPVSFAGKVVEKGDHTLVIEAREIGADSSMAFTSISVKAINSDDGDTFEDLLQDVEQLPYLQEVIAIIIVGFLLILLLFNARRRALKNSIERDAQINSIRQNRLSNRSSMAGVFGLDDNPLEDRIR